MGRYVIKTSKLNKIEARLNEDGDDIYPTFVNALLDLFDDDIIEYED